MKVGNQEQQAEDEVEKAYCTPQALGKAGGKVKPHLPKSPRKQKAVIKKLALGTGISLAKKKKDCVAGKKGLHSSTPFIRWTPSPDSHLGERILLFSGKMGEKRVCKKGIYYFRSEKYMPFF